MLMTYEHYKKVTQTEFNFGVVEGIGGPFEVRAKRLGKGHLELTYSSLGIERTVIISDDDESSFHAGATELMKKISGLGKLCIAEYSGASADDKRMFLKPSPWAKYNEEQERICGKHGWWNLFTLATEAPASHGLWICEVAKYVHDKNGHIMAIVKPIRKVTDGLQIIIQLMIWNDRKVRKELRDFNWATAYTDNEVRAPHINSNPLNIEWISNWNWREYYKLFRGGADITQEVSRMTQLLHTPTQGQLLMEEYKKEIGRASKENVNVRTRLEKFSNVEDFINEVDQRYNHLVDSGKLEEDKMADIGAKAIIVCDYYARLKEMAKAKKAAEKKAKKKTAKEQ